MSDSTGRNTINTGGDYVAGNKAGRDYIEGSQNNINNTGEGAIIGNTVSGGININKNNMNDIDSQFKNSIVEFENLLNEKLKRIKISEEEIKSLQEDIEKLSRQVKDVKPAEIIKNEEKVKEMEVTQISLAEKIVKYLPEVAESIAAATPLALFSKVIGRGTGIVTEWIIEKLKQTR